MNFPRCLCIAVLLAVLSGCVAVPLSSRITTHDYLEKALPLNQGDVVVVDGENAAKPRPDSSSFTDAMLDYVTAGCTAQFHSNTIAELIRTILKINPQPGLFAVRHINKEGIGEKKHVRYKIYVKETFEVETHIPLYLAPFGMASCGNRTNLEAAIWELPTDRFLGSYKVSAEGEYSVAAYLLHVVTYRDTQKDAMVKLVREIVQRLTGLEPLEDNTE